jgi:hypothetical protein
MLFSGFEFESHHPSSFSKCVQGPHRPISRTYAFEPDRVLLNLFLIANNGKDFRHGMSNRLSGVLRNSLKRTA